MANSRRLASEVVHDGDVVLTAAQGGLVNAHGLHAGKAVQGTGLADMELNASPQLLVRTAQQVGRLAHRQLAAQRQGQRFEGRGDARSRAGLRHARLRGLAAAATGDARAIAVQPGLELEEVQVTPRAAQPVM